MKEQNHIVADVLLGAAAGAAVSAAGMYLAGRNERELRHLARKVSHGAENAVSSLENALDSFLR